MMQFSNNFDSSGQNFNDYRYQKALKQISKLIAVNREIKLQAQEVKAQNQELYQKFSQILNQNKFLQNQVESTRQNLQNLSLNYSNLQNFCEKLQRQNKESKNMQQKSDSILRQRQEKVRSEFDQSKQRWIVQKNQLFKRLQESQRTVEHYHQKLQNLLQLQKQVQRLAIQIKNLQEAKQVQRRKSTILSQQLLSVKKKINQNPPEDLVAKLKISQDWIKNLNQECYELKQKLLQADYQKQRTSYMTNIKNIPILYTNKNQKKNNQTMDKLQTQKHKLRQKYEKIKLKLSKLQAQILQLKQQNALLTTKVKGYQKLTQRQQIQIQQLIFSMNSNHESTQSLFKDEEFKIMIDNLKVRNQQLRNQSIQKDDHLKYYQQLVRSLNSQKDELISTLRTLESQLSISQTTVNADLSKTYKANSINDSITKTKSLVKAQNGPKVFIINGKKYQKYPEQLKDIQSVNSPILRHQQSFVVDQPPIFLGNKKVHQSGEFIQNNPAINWNRSINVTKIK